MDKRHEKVLHLFFYRKIQIWRSRDIRITQSFWQWSPSFLAMWTSDA